MIKHIVMWKFKDGVAEEDQIEMKLQLEGLMGVVPTLAAISVGLDISRKERSWDIVLYSEFNSMEELKAYAVHPQHLKVAEFIKTVVCEAAAVDYEV
jgi:hypothetical protein